MDRFDNDKKETNETIPQDNFIAENEENAAEIGSIGNTSNQEDNLHDDSAYNNEEVQHIGGNDIPKDSILEEGHHAHTPYEADTRPTVQVPNPAADNVVHQIHDTYGYKRPSGMSYLASALIGAIIGGTITAAAVPALYGKIIPYPKYMGGNQIGQQITINPTEDITVASAVAKKLTPTVVGITTVAAEQDLFGFGRYAEGVGSGVIVNANGYILTNAHVVGENPRKLTIYFKDGREVQGDVLWQDSALDLAVVKVDVANLPTAELGDSEKIDVGEISIAIGNPLGLRYERTVTQGIISGLNRSVRPSDTEIMEDLIQTDAAINPGNSGGPLINSRGQVIGINTIKASAEGLGFAIPVNIAKPIINQLITTGKFEPTYMGIIGYDKEIAGYYQNTVEVPKGIYIHKIIPGSTAAKAGIKPGDVILSLDGVETNTMLKLKSILYSKKAGDTVSVRYVRGDKEGTVEVALMGEREANR